jgi:uncharacterized membrane protein
MNMATSPTERLKSTARRLSAVPKSKVPTQVQRAVRTMGDRETLNRSLGWFSIGLGLTQMLAPKALGRAIGVGDQSTIMRLCGMREIATGVGLLSGAAPAAFSTSRVLGDVMDLALLGASLRSPQANPSRIAAAATAVASVTAVDMYASKLDIQDSMARAAQDLPVTVTLAINSTPEKLYEFWRKLENLPRFMQNLESVRETGDRTSHWIARMPGGVRLQWQSEIVDDQPNQCISWRTREGSEVNHCGSVRFETAPAGRGTLVRVEMYYGLPGGHMAEQAAKLFSAAPETVIQEDLRRLKQLIETGEIATTRGQPSGARSLMGRTFTKGSP